ncbi:hypothetical protein HUG10_11720 [Halorarum halophilum]|uniref:PLD phosphodiesterase domain-containing protein n=1 Tax=Halorarum halophilum TaxID=2743090 RepID=A0A7D5KG98_9EURY|nr:hypothetical protein [Halobaculum halophilum]QLG28176.1 hypothetical protein HUG10_11720 [Halobaculum halophilum]
MGDPIAQRAVEVGSKKGGSSRTVTDQEGRFKQEVPANTHCRVGFYKYKYGPLPQKPDGIPHVCSLGRYPTVPGNNDLGTLQIEQAHLVEARALDSEGNPVGNADVRLYAEGVDGDYWGTGPNSLTTNHEGFVVVDDSPYTGMELIGSIDFSISIPNKNGGSIEYERKFYVDEPLSITAQIGEGMTISSVEKKSTETQEMTPVETTAGTSEPTVEPSPKATEASGSLTTRPPRTQTGNETSQNDKVERRGFFSNDSAGEEFEALSDPFVLTVAGFALSACGIAHQLIRGS